MGVADAKDRTFFSAHLSRLQNTGASRSNHRILLWPSDGHILPLCLYVNNEHLRRLLLPQVTIRSVK